ncbi:MAG: hypothetical protein KF730_17260 [Sphingomonas sp.]|uniref:hypothetical protein n=1 Tax=Sphingomonas sp. TaxID=28214 RepID=UPI0025FEB6ED|nr:hypothetical protein [Sphingomonas sp.]MBX3566311.1 hypothetical protein [Sphingomonas sp.]
MEALRASEAMPAGLVLFGLADLAWAGKVPPNLIIDQFDLENQVDSLKRFAGHRVFLAGGVPVRGTLSVVVPPDLVAQRSALNTTVARLFPGALENACRHAGLELGSLHDVVVADYQSPAKPLGVPLAQAMLGSSVSKALNKTAHKICKRRDDSSIDFSAATIGGKPTLLVSRRISQRAVDENCPAFDTGFIDLALVRAAIASKFEQLIIAEDVLVLDGAAVAALAEQGEIGLFHTRVEDFLCLRD